MEEKVYEPEIIQDNPFPGETVQTVFSPTQDGSKGIYGPTTTKERTFPKKRTAVELLSTALNTRSRKVLQEFELTQSGGFQIGNFEQGRTGDLRLTPNGLTARNIAGLTTFAIDGTTGDAIFKGTVQAGAVISADINGERILANTLDADRIMASTIDVAVDVGTGVGGAYVRLDGANNRIIINDGTNNRVLIGFQSGGF